MATYQGAVLDALGDPTRRAIFERLGQGPTAVGELANNMPVSRPAVSQHLARLKAAGLVVDQAVGTRRLYRLNPHGIDAMRTYFEQFWTHALSDFKALAENRGELMTQQQAATDVRVSVSVEASTERAFQVFTQRVGSWWPRAHHLGEREWVEVVIEPHVGGRWFERSEDGTDCDWGHVLVWEPSHHLALSWQLGVNFDLQTNPELASRIEVRFEPAGPDRTTVTLVHSDFEKHGEGWESMRSGVADEGGWSAIMAGYAEVAAA